MIPFMAIDESERIPKWRFYSSDQALHVRVAASETRHECAEQDWSEGAPSFLKIPPHSPLRRTCSVPTSFKERKRHFQTHKRSKTSPLPMSPSTSGALVSADRKRKWRALEPRCNEHRNCQRWAYARRDEYNRYLIPRTSSTDSTMTVDKEEAEDGTVLLGLAFVDEV